MAAAELYLKRISEEVNMILIREEVMAICLGRLVALASILGERMTEVHNSSQNTILFRHQSAHYPP